MNFEEFFKENKKVIVLTTACVLVVVGVFSLGNPRVAPLLLGLFVAMLLSKMLVLHEYGVDAS